MISINTNLGSLIVQSNLKTSTLGLNQAIERMTTGFKINQAKDNAANFSISTNLTTKIGAYEVAEENAAMGLDLVTTASESLNLIEEKLTRLRALQEQASNGTYGEDSLKAINSEVNALVDEINRLYRTTEYNGLNLFQSVDQQATPIMANYALMTLSLEDEPQAQSSSKFINEVIQTTPDIVVSDPTQLASAISNNTIIGISNAETLAELATLVNSGTNCSGKTIVLTNDIDMKDWCAAHEADGGWTPIGFYTSSKYFLGDFDGNGYVISNLSSTQGGLFGCIYHGRSVKNLGLENLNATNGIVGATVPNGITVDNCYVTGNISGTDRVGAIIGATTGEGGKIANCYSTANVSGSGDYVGGLLGTDDVEDSIIENSFSTGKVSGANYVGGLAGNMSESNGIHDSYTTSIVSGSGSNVGAVAGFYDGRALTNVVYYSEQNKGMQAFGNGYTSTSLIDKVSLPKPPETPDPTDPDVGGGTTPTPPPFSPTPAGVISFQVGIGSDAHSQISLDTSFVLEGIEDLRGIGLDVDTDFLGKIDEMLSVVTAKQTEYGAAQNRFESALEQIGVNYENLVSTRSTIRDADIADESSNYIKMQILQQASATLLATANQTPSIALQLL